MIKAILVPSSGSETDFVVFSTALASARLYGAHLHFYHVHVSAGEALGHSEHGRFARGAGLKNALHELTETHAQRLMLAHRHVTEFCSQHEIAMTERPVSGDEITASWQQESGHGEDRLITAARCHDLVVMGRFTRTNGLPPDLLGLLLIGCGRPILIAAPEAPRTLTGTIVVCWKEGRESAHAVGAAMPFLVKAERVIVLTIDEGRGSSTNSAAALAQQLLWHRVDAKVETRSAGRQSTADTLLSQARSFDADLLVMGGYGRGRMMETVLGGCTDSILHGASLPVLMVH